MNQITQIPSKEELLRESHDVILAYYREYKRRYRQAHKDMINAHNREYIKKKKDLEVKGIPCLHNQIEPINQEDPISKDGLFDFKQESLHNQLKGGEEK